jgi:hypothetical protein
MCTPAPTQKMEKISEQWRQAHSFCLEMQAAFWDPRAPPVPGAADGLQPSYIILLPGGLRPLSHLQGSRVAAPPPLQVVALGPFGNARRVPLRRQPLRERAEAQLAVCCAQKYAGGAWAAGPSSTLGACSSKGCACVAGNSRSLAVDAADGGMADRLVNDQSGTYYSIGWAFHPWPFCPSRPQPSRPPAPKAHLPCCWSKLGFPPRQRDGGRRRGMWQRECSRTGACVWLPTWRGAQRGLCIRYLGSDGANSLSADGSRVLFFDVDADAEAVGVAPAAIQNAMGEFVLPQDADLNLLFDNRWRL